MKTQIIEFGSDRLRTASTGALILFFEALNDKGHKEINVQNVVVTAVDAKNSRTTIYYAAPYDRITCPGGGRTYIKMKDYKWESQHANDFCCSSSGIHEIK